MHMGYIVLVEHRPFSYLDFENFVVDSKNFSVPHGTCRNKFCYFAKIGLIEVEYYSRPVFYTLKCHHFTIKNTMTDNHMGIPSVIPVTIKDEMQELLDYLKTIPVDQASVHDLHYKFVVPEIYKIMSFNSRYAQLINPVSKDILLNAEIIDGLRIQPIIHRTNTITVSVACSARPIPINESGILAISCALTRVEERLASKLDECGNALPGGYERIPIPDNRRWTVTMWHFGKDRKFEYKNGSSLTWGYGREVLRSYPKTINGKKFRRDEKQEYPNKSHEDAFNEKLKDVDDKSDSKEEDKT